MNSQQKESFWKHLEAGGSTPEGDNYSVIERERLHILSKNNRNESYHITKKTVMRYLDEVEENEKKLQIKVSYFYRIYRHILNILKREQK